MGKLKDKRVSNFLSLKFLKKLSQKLQTFGPNSRGASPEEAGGTNGLIRLQFLMHFLKQKAKIFKCVQKQKRK